MRKRVAAQFALRLINAVAESARRPLRARSQFCRGQSAEAAQGGRNFMSGTFPPSRKNDSFFIQFAVSCKVVLFLRDGKQLLE
jgi:hypothetical protein